ncbi:MAG: PAS domain S-box protein [Coleofasciculus sp. C1-SOL-03]|uniref:PAS domain S-box protein n=1 Tax=Coleofasciculus sp. C1-SOL-03 TaxID=3069522 RepID=UPI0033006BF0
MSIATAFKLNHNNGLAINRYPLTATPDISVEEALARMTQTHSSCLLVLANHQPNSPVVGIFTERDTVQLIASGVDWRTLSLASVMTTSVMTITETEAQDIVTVINRLRQYKIRHLPVVGERGNLIGVITPQTIRDVLQPVDLLNHKKVSDVMATRVIHAMETTSILELAQVMNAQRVSCVVIVEETEFPVSPQNSVKAGFAETLPSIAQSNFLNPSLHTQNLLRPIGIVTERDIVQFGNLGLDLANTPVTTVMSTPLLLIQPTDSIWSAHQLMQQHRVRRLVVSSEAGELAGLITQTQILNTINPIDIYQTVDTLEHLLDQQTSQLRQLNQQLRQEISKRELLQAKFQSSEAKIRAVFEAMTDIVLVIDTHDHQIQEIEVIPTASSCLYDDTTFMDQTIQRLLGDPSQTDSVWVETIQQAIATQQTLTLDYCLWLQGREVWFSASISPIAEHSVVWVARDISDRQRMEAELRESEDCFRKAFNYAASGMALVALDGHFLKVNRYLCDILGYSEAELLAKTCAEITHPNDLEAERDYTRQLLNGDIRYYHLEKRYSHKQGHSIWILLSVSLVRDSQGNPLYSLAQMQDITERKQIEEALQGNQRLLRAITQANPSILYIYDRIHKQILYFNRKIQNLLGYTPEDVIQMEDDLLVTLMHPDDLPRILHHFQHLETAQADQVFDLEYRIKHKNGEWRWLSSRETVFTWNQEGKPEQILGTATDISDRKQAEAALRESEERWQLALQGNQDGIWDWNITTGQALISDRYREILDYDDDQFELDFQGWQNRLHPDDLSLVNQSLQDYLAQKIPHYAIEYRFRCQDGTYKWLQSRAQALWDDAGYPVRLVGSTRDITERKQAEEQLRYQKELLQKIFDHIPVMICFYDATGHIRLVNREVERVLGWDKAELDTIDLLTECYPNPTDRQKVLDFMFKASGKWQDFSLRTKNGQILETSWANIRLSDGTSIGIGQDITERKRAEIKLRKSEERWQLALKGNNDGIWDYNLITHEHFLSPRCLEILGYDYETINTFDKWMSYIHSDHVSLVQDTFERHLNRETPDYSLEYQMRCQDGSYKWVLVRGQAHWDELGNPVRAVGSITDITERKQAEERERQKTRELEFTLNQLKRTQTQLIQAEKMSSLGQMVAGIAHEINNPTSFIYGNIEPATEYAQTLLHLVQLYRQHYPEPVSAIAEELDSIDLDFISYDFPKLLTSMREGAKRITKIVQSLRNFSRLDEAEYKRVDIHQGIDNTLLLLQHRLKQQSSRPQIHLIKDYCQLPKVKCYPGQLNQVFMNILSNAIDALEDKLESDLNFEPKIWIRTAVIPGEEGSKDSENQGGAKVVIYMGNNGAEIPTEVYQRIFDPFFTTKPVGKGTGLGLSISYQIVVERHGGELRCDSTPGKGTEFAIELPS